MIKQIVSASVGIAVFAACAADAAGTQTELVGSVEIAAFSEFQQKVVDVGTTINNPAVPMLVCPALQNALTEQFGKFRQDAPVKVLCYANASSVRKVLSGDVDEMPDNAFEPVLLYPSAEDATAFLASHQGAQKKADGSIELEDGSVALFAADGRTCAFALNAASAKRALAAPSIPAAANRPLVRMDITELGLSLLADLHKKMATDQAALVKESSTNATEQLVAAFMKLQQSQMQRQNALLRKFARAEMTIDLDATGFVVKGSGTLKPGVSYSPAAGFQLPAGALDAVPAGAPFFFAMNSLLQSGIQNEQEFRTMIGGVRPITDSLFACLRQEAPEYAEIADGLRTATADLLAAVPYPGPAEWDVGAIAFGPQQEPYMVVAGESPKAAQANDAGIRFYAALDKILGKKWPGVVSANGATLTLDWAKLIDVVAAVSGATKEEQKEVDQAKKTLALILGGTASECSTRLLSPTTYRTFLGTKGFTPPAAAPSGEARLAAVLPEAAAKRPANVFYLSLYSLMRDNVLPIVLKAMPKKDTAEIQQIVSVLPPSGANGALAAAVWCEKSGSCSFLMRITKDEIRNFGAAANAIMAAQAQAQSKSSEK